MVENSELKELNQGQVSFIQNTSEAEVVQRFGSLPEDSDICRKAYLSLSGGKEPEAADFQKKLVQFEGDIITTWMWFLMRERDIKPGPI